VCYEPGAHGKTPFPHGIGFVESKHSAKCLSTNSGRQTDEREREREREREKAARFEERRDELPRDQI
jgi:hypothetical protein